jgi:type IV fimbrial biogenesis protein FimT
MISFKNTDIMQNCMHMKQRVIKNIRGLTLVELMMVIAILAILMALAAPVNSWMTSARLSSFTNQVSTALAYAKSESIRLGSRVTVCKSAAPTAATPACSDDDGSWARGWIVFADNTHETSNVAGTIDGTDMVLKVGDKMTEVIVTTGDNFDDWVSFLPSGLSRGGGGSQGGMFTLCLPNKSGSTISVNSIGRVQTARFTCP